MTVVEPSAMRLHVGGLYDRHMMIHLLVYLPLVVNVNNHVSRLYAKHGGCILLSEPIEHES